MDTELKKYTTVAEQIEMLKKRGLLVDDEDYTYGILNRYNYYRLSGYSLTLRKNDKFYKDIHFENIVEIYDCDTELRAILLSFIEGIEISFRTHLAQYLGRIAPTAYQDIKIYEPKDAAFDIKAMASAAIYDSRNEAFVKHHKDNYKGKLPVWVFVETISFGTASKIFASLKVEHSKSIAEEYYAPIRHTYIERWMEALSVLRNMCAHRSRLFNRGLSKAFQYEETDLKIFDQFGYDRNQVGKKVFFAVPILLRLHPCEAAGEHLIAQLRMLFEKYPFVDIKHYGFNNDWINILEKVNEKYSK